MRTLMQMRAAIRRLEAALRHTAACPLCRDHPMATVCQLVEADPHGPGFRLVGEELCEEDRERITDDLRCRACGRAASVDYLEVIAHLYDRASRSRH